jgi:hypothetical protein
MPRRLQGSVAVVTEASDEPRPHGVSVSRDEQGWWVRLSASSHRECYPTLTQAIHRGRMLAHQHKPSVLVIHHRDGEEERHEFEPCEASLAAP